MKAVSFAEGEVEIRLAGLPSGKNFCSLRFMGTVHKVYNCT